MDMTYWRKKIEIFQAALEAEMYDGLAPDVWQALDDVVVALGKAADALRDAEEREANRNPAEEAALEEGDARLDVMREGEK